MDFETVSVFLAPVLRSRNAAGAASLSSENLNTSLHGKGPSTT